IDEAKTGAVVGPNGGNLRVYTAAMQAFVVAIHNKRHRRVHASKHVVVGCDHITSHRSTCTATRTEVPTYVSVTVGLNSGGRRTFVSCSYAYASESSLASEYGRPMNETPTGRPNA